MKRMGTLSVLATAVGLTTILWSCGADDGPTGRGEGGRLEVCTTFYPVTYFTSRVGGDLVEVVCPLPPGEDPIFWQPDDAALARYRAADLVVINGATFEKWVDSASLPESRLVDSSRGLADRLIKYEEATTHSHGPRGEHTHEGTDGHTWVDPNNARAQAEVIRDALIARLPGREKTLRANFAALAKELDGLDRALREIAETEGLRTVFASHPAYNYLVSRYGFPIVNLDLDPEALPDDHVRHEIEKARKKAMIETILWESAPSAEVREAYEAEFGLKSLVVSPCETMPESAIQYGRNYMVVMGENVGFLKTALLP